MKEELKEFLVQFALKYNPFVFKTPKYDKYNPDLCVICRKAIPSKEGRFTHKINGKCCIGCSKHLTAQLTATELKEWLLTYK